MRRESSTVVALAGSVRAELLAGLSRSPNISLVGSPSGRRPDEPANGQPAERQDWEPGARAMREAARRRSTYVVVADDPLAGAGAAWRAMWDLTTSPQGAAAFEDQVAEAPAAWRGKRFELPDYYLVVPEPDDSAGADLYLGPLRAARPRRVALATISASDRGPIRRNPAADTCRNVLDLRCLVASLAT
jgi:hypothetical protein